MNDTELIAQLHLITKQRRLRKALSNIASLPPPGELDSNSANEITPSPERHTTFCRYINCPGDNTVEVTRCEACKKDVDHVQCFKRCGELARKTFIVKPTGHSHLCYNCWCKLAFACPKHGEVYAAQPPIEPVNLFGSVSTASSPNNAELPSSSTTCCRYKDCPGDNTVEVAKCEACNEIVDHIHCFKRCRELARVSFDVQPTSHRHLCLHCWRRHACPTYAHLYAAALPIDEDNFSDYDSELARMELSNVNKGVKRTNPYIENNKMNSNQDNNEDLKGNDSSSRHYPHNPSTGRFWRVESLEEMWTCLSRHPQTCALCEKMMPEGTYIENVIMTMEKSSGKIVSFTRWVHYDCEDNGYHGERRTREERGMTKQIALHSPTSSMASNGEKSNNRDQGRDGRGNNLCSGSELKQHQKIPGNINQGNLTNKTCDGSDLTETSTAAPLNLNNVSSTLPTETITFNNTSPTKKKKTEPSIPPARTIAKKKTEPSIPPARMATNSATRMLTLKDSSIKNKKKRQSKSRDDDHSLLGKQSIESTTNDYVKDDWLVSDNDDSGNYSSSVSGSDWVMANKTEHETRAKRKKLKLTDLVLTQVRVYWTRLIPKKNTAMIAAAIQRTTVKRITMTLNNISRTEAFDAARRHSQLIHNINKGPKACQIMGTS